jgi:hypothetical protein
LLINLLIKAVWGWRALRRARHRSPVRIMKPRTIASAAAVTTATIPTLGAWRSSRGNALIAAQPLKDLSRILTPTGSSRTWWRRAISVRTPTAQDARAASDIRQ